MMGCEINEHPLGFELRVYVGLRDRDEDPEIPRIEKWNALRMSGHGCGEGRSANPIAPARDRWTGGWCGPAMRNLLA